MEQIRLIMLVESRIRGDVYVRFGGEYLKTYHSNMIRRWVLSLLKETVKIYEQGKKYYDALKSVNNLVKDARKRFSPKMTERQADALLRSDLRKLCAMFRGFGRDSLLLATLAYNVGCGKVMKSRMYAKMRSGNRNIYRDYVDFKRWNGKIVPSIERRRKMEYLLLFE